MIMVTYEVKFEMEWYFLVVVCFKYYRKKFQGNTIDGTY